MRFRRYRYVLLIAALALSACSSDDPVAPDPTPLTQPDLQEREDVLAGLESVFNMQDFDEFARLVDSDFTFFFSPNDVNEGNVPQSTLDAGDMMRATANMFGGGSPVTRVAAYLQTTEESTWGVVTWFCLSNPELQASSVNLTFSFESGEDEWTPSQNDETLYHKTITYLLTVKVGEITFTSGTPINARVGVRYTERPSGSHWRLVEMFDDI